MHDMNTLLKSAVSETKYLNEGESFLVKDLFKGYLWNRIPRGDRLLLGSMFLSYVGSSQDCHIVVSNKGASGQQMYRYQEERSQKPSGSKKKTTTETKLKQ